MRNAIEDVAFALVNHDRAKHNVPEFNSIESMKENLVPKALEKYIDIASCAIQAYNLSLDSQ